jgi:uncharacterized protein (TIGR02996 family)
MTTEEDFQKQLDENPEDANTRLVFADWLEERGDERAEGYRALGRGGYYPDRSSNGNSSGWWSLGTQSNARHECYKSSEMLPYDWFLLFKHSNRLPDWEPVAWAYLPTRKDVEDAAAIAFAKLPAERRAELLRTQEVSCSPG